MKYLKQHLNKSIFLFEKFNEFDQFVWMKVNSLQIDILLEYVKSFSKVSIQINMSFY